MTAGDIIEKYDWLISKYRHHQLNTDKTLIKMSILYTEVKQVLLNGRFDRCNINRLDIQGCHSQRTTERKLKKELVNAIFSKINKEIEVYVDETNQKTVISELKYNGKYTELYEAAYESPHKLFPYLYKEISPEDKDFLKALYTKDEDLAATALEKLMQQLNKQMTTLCVKEVFVAPVQKQLDVLTKKRETLQATIAKEFDEINKLYKDMQEIKISIDGLIKHPDETGDEIIKALENNSNIFLSPSDSAGQVDVRVEELLDYFDEELAMRMFTTTSSILYHSIKNYINKNQLVTLFAGLFVLKLGKLKICSLTSLSKDVLYCKKCSVVSAGYYPNPHINNYSCLGENRPYIDNYLLSGDYDQAIFQIMSATKSLTLDDSPVLDSFFADMQNIMLNYAKGKIFLCNNGKEMNIEEFVTYCENHESYKQLLKEVK